MNQNLEQTITIEQVVELMPEWQGKRINCTPLSGGLTNLNYKVEVDALDLFVRIPGPQAELLAVDREYEYYNSMAAAKAGVAPKVIRYLKQHNIMIMEFIQGRTMNNQEIAKPGRMARLSKSMKMLHSGPRFVNDFNMFRLVEHYLKVVEENQVAIPPDYLDHLPKLSEIEQAIRVNFLPSVPCHNDLVAENLIDDGQILRMVDFEYSGNNDPCFEMGDAATEMGLSEDQVSELCEAYFGRRSRSLKARILLLGLVSDIGWVLWTAIQNKISKIEFDFWKHMMFRWNRATSLMDSSRFSELLKECQE
jgi:thiamine kinase-like enzyme